MHDCSQDVRCWRTKPIEEYGPELRSLAEDLFQRACEHVSGDPTADVGGCCVRYKGSLSIRARDTGETSAKIVLYEAHTGGAREDGVYVWIRANGRAGSNFEKTAQASDFTHRWVLDRFEHDDGDCRREVCVAPNPLEHFYYFRVDPREDLTRIARLLAFCATLEVDEDETFEVAKNMFGDSLYQRRARKALPILVRQASAGQKIFYGDLARELGMSNARNLNYVLGSVGKTLQELGDRWHEKVPAIQCLVVNQQTGLPGSGVDRMIAGIDAAELDQPHKEALVRGILADVFAYPKWLQVLQALNLEAPEPALDAEALQRIGYGGKGESDEHKSLKKYIAEHPECVGLPKSTPLGETEHLLPSADKIDVLFTHRDSASGRVVALTAVEVKTHVSDEVDLKRGLFQCVKYDALLRACRSVEMASYEVTVLLALEGGCPETLIPVKNTLSVRVLEQVHPESPEQRTLNS